MKNKRAAPHRSSGEGTASPPIIVSIEDPVETDALAAAAERGFDHVLLNHSGAVGGELTGTTQFPGWGPLTPLVRLRIDLFDPADPLVGRYPDHFALRDDFSDEHIADPRGPSPSGDHALADLTSDNLPDEIGDHIRRFLIDYLEQGASGFVFDGLDADARPFYQVLLDELRRAHPGVVAIGATPGLSRKDAATLAKAGFDYLLSSFSWWDMRARWLVEEHTDLSPHTPLLANITSSRAAQASDPAQARGLLIAAAFTGNGLVAPIDLVKRCGDGPDIAKLATTATGSGGRLQLLTSAGSPVTALVRESMGSIEPRSRVRDFDETILLVNTGADQAQAPDELMVGREWEKLQNLTGPQDAMAPLAPGETRLVSARHAKPVQSKIGNGKKSARAAAAQPRIVIENLSPAIAGGDFAVKRVVGETIVVTADIYTDGHEKVAARLLWRAETEKGWQACDMVEEGNDVWTASFRPTRMGRHEYAVEAWNDRFGYYREGLAKKVEAGVAQPVDFMEGRALIEEARDHDPGEGARSLDDHLAAYDRAEGDDERAKVLTSPELAELMARHSEREHLTGSRAQAVDAERIAARFSSWYELFPRSMTDDKGRHGTLRDVIDHLPRVADMGFDTLYFPPIHPIGETNRKGPNNTLTPTKTDPGSPYAIGSGEGGHDAIHPELGTFEDLRDLIAAAKEHGLEIALDFAIQCSPDHPWLKEHPGWFAWRPDGSMKYAENPPKKYQDIVNVDFYGPDAVPDLWIELRDVVLLWVKEGIKTFRVDNPHTKPLTFWEWMIREVRTAHPEVIFLSEAFTRPKVMYRLAKAGFTQGYTYFTWRNSKAELTEYIEELTSEAPRDFFRPHFFVNTPDINPVFLQTGGRPAHRIRAVLAATLSGLWGVYSGFELCDAAPLPGREEYADSEKFEIRPRDWRKAGDIVDDITLLNRLRRGHPALRTHLNTNFYAAYDDNVIYYGKPSADGSDIVLVAVNMDPHGEHGCDFEVPLWELGLPDDGSVAVEDLVWGGRFTWTGKVQHVHLTPDEPYRIWRIEPLGDRNG